VRAAAGTSHVIGVQWVLFIIITGRGLAWASSAAQMTGEQHARAVVFHLCSVLAFAQAVAVVALLCRYLAAARRDAGRPLAAVRFMFVAAVVLMGMSVCVGIDADWRIGAAVLIPGGCDDRRRLCALHLWETGLVWGRR
jgi:phosphatidylglycerophosphate synthase